MVTVNAVNTAPAVDAGPNATINEGDTFSGPGSFTDPDADTWTATVDYGDGSGVGPLALNPDKTFDLIHIYTSAAGSPFTVTVEVDDGTAAGTATALVTVNAVNTVTLTAALQGNTNKRTGLQKIKLRWTGAAGTNVDVYRNTAFVATAANDGTYTDSVGIGGYVYQVCETNSGPCSNEALISF